MNVSRLPMVPMCWEGTATSGQKKALPIGCASEISRRAIWATNYRLSDSIREIMVVKRITPWACDSKWTISVEYLLLGGAIFANRKGTEIFPLLDFKCYSHP